MVLADKKNPAGVLLHAFAYWWSLRHTRAFAAKDAWVNWREWLLPARVSHRAYGEALAKEVTIEPFEPGVHRISVTGHDIVFFWLGKVDNNLHYTIAQEFDPDCPHFYTSAPIQLTPESVVLDVGACEGLFACRVLRQGLAAKVICFEPSARTADYLRRSAEANGVGERIVTEVMAVSRKSGTVYFAEGDTPQANSISSTPGAKPIPAVALDDYCAEHQLKLTSRDLIKIDAEGADLDVLLGAEKLLRNSAPQIAVTTYHKVEHAREILAYLKSVQPAYRFRIKGLTLFGPVRFFGGTKPRPVLLQAAVPSRT
jgi:FkbM family methyltransferase